MRILSTLSNCVICPSFYALLNSSKILCGISQNAPMMFTLLLTVEDLARAQERDPTTDDIFLDFTFFGRVDWQNIGLVPCVERIGVPRGSPASATALKSFG